MHNNSKINISRSALESNLSFLREIYGAETKISSVVKGNAYGHSVSEFVSLAAKLGVDHFSVFDSEEARLAKAVLPKNQTVMIMGYLSKDDIPWAIQNDVEFYIFEFGRLKDAINAAKNTNKKALVHIEIETGMNRTGFDESQISELINILKQNGNYIDFKGLCTHYAGAESHENNDRVNAQIQLYKTIQQRFADEDLIPEIRHTACSAASIMFPETRMDMVRIGIMQYGFWPSKEVAQHFLLQNPQYKNPLTRLITWKSQIMSLKIVGSGENIGYGTSFTADKDLIIAVVPIGYGHGYSRSLSNNGRVLIHGRRCDVIGTVNMNMITIDVSALENVSENDEVVLIGSQGEDAISVSSFSDLSDQLNYELLTRISRSIPRTIEE